MRFVFLLPVAPQLLYFFCGQKCLAIFLDFFTLSINLKHYLYVMRCSSFLSPFEDGAPEMSVTFILGYARGFKFEAEAAFNRK